MPIHPPTDPKIVERIREMYLAGASNGDICDECGVTGRTIRKHVEDLGYRDPGVRQERRALIRDMAAIGWWVKDIARELDCSIGVVVRALKGGVPEPTRAIEASVQRRLEARKEALRQKEAKKLARWRRLEAEKTPEPRAHVDLYEAREIRRARSRAWHIANRERALAANRAWYQANKEKHGDLQRERRLAKKLDAMAEAMPTPSIDA